MFNFDLSHLITALISMLVAIGFTWGVIRTNISTLHLKVIGAETRCGRVEAALASLHKEYVTHSMFEQAHKEVNRAQDRIEKEVGAIREDTQRILHLLIERP